MILGKAGQLPGKLAPEIVEKLNVKAKSSSQATHRTIILISWKIPSDDVGKEMGNWTGMMKNFEYAMHPAQYEAYKSGKAKADSWKM